MKYVQSLLIIVMVMSLSVLFLVLASVPVFAQSLVLQWKQGLGGAMLTAASGGSIVSDHSTLTVIRFCYDGRYSYYKEGGWSIPGSAQGASNNTITGRWDIKQSGQNVSLVYATDSGKQGYFPIYLQNNGQVNIGGTAFTAEKGKAGC